MTKKERLHTIKMMQKKWLVLRLVFAIPIGVCWYLFMQSEQFELLYGGLLIGGIAMAANLFLYDSRMIKKLSSNEDVKQIIDLQHRFSYALLIMVGVVLPIILKLNLIHASTFILFIGGLVLIGYAQRQLDRQLRWIDSEQPTFQEIQRTRFRFRT
ncbi:MULTISPECIES: hypothetical protein [Exiguobacterium]|uniref:hypothetical protein n=1 Tax=Exiguobacterium TaxID=33986 RepID=UPI001BE83D0E|nr:MULTISPECIES: hypothetical protein [Exiguobacterium]MCT4782691.1 hypothetical protein [Exiguobacterium himgiriensis]